jgi:hypothetical protein
MSGMTAAAANTPSGSPPEPVGAPPAGWEALRADADLQFAPVPVPDIPPRRPGWLERLLSDLVETLGEWLGPVGAALGDSWWWLQWVVAGAVGLFALVLLTRLIAPELLRLHQRTASGSAATEEWRPDTAASLALLEDADRLAADGRFDAATRLLLRRSIGHIAAARPDWVEPSTTARELAALMALPDAARVAFGVIAVRVEASLFALRALDRGDWEAARAAYAEFALARINPQGHAA